MGQLKWQEEGVVVQFHMEKVQRHRVKEVRHKKKEGQEE